LHNSNARAPTIFILILAKTQQTPLLVALLFGAYRVGGVRAQEERSGKDLCLLTFVIYLIWTFGIVFDI
jgi:hypothetical protein